MKPAGTFLPAQLEGLALTSVGPQLGVHLALTILGPGLGPGPWMDSPLSSPMASAHIPSWWAIPSPSSSGCSKHSVGTMRLVYEPCGCPHGTSLPVPAQRLLNPSLGTLPYQQCCFLPQVLCMGPCLSCLYLIPSPPPVCPQHTLTSGGGHEILNPAPWCLYSGPGALRVLATAVV